MDHRPPLRDVTNQLSGHSGQGLKRSRPQTDAALPDDHSHGKCQVYLIVGKNVYKHGLIMVQVRSLIIVHASVLTVLNTKRQKAKDRYAKLTVEQKAQRNAKRREAYAMKKNASRLTEMHTLVANSGNVSPT